MFQVGVNRACLGANFEKTTGWQKDSNGDIVCTDLKSRLRTSSVKRRVNKAMWLRPRSVLRKFVVALLLANATTLFANDLPKLAGTNTVADVRVLSNIHESNRLLYSELVYERDKNSQDYSQKYAVNCHLLAYKKSIFGIQGYAFSTYRVNHCKPNDFMKLSAVSVKAQLRTFIDLDFVILTGPHLQMMDRNFTPIENKYIPLGNLNFTMIGAFKIGLLDNIRRLMYGTTGLSYTPVKIKEDVYYVWYPHSKIYRLVDDSGRVFVMTNLSASSTIGSDNQLEDFAANVGSQISLPSGWRYEVGVIKRLLSIRNISEVKQETTRIMDDFGNYYIEIDPRELTLQAVQ